jgi:hypothetical protein
MYIKDEELRIRLREILMLKTKNQIVLEIQSTGEKFHQYTIDRFLSNKPVNLYSLKKLDRYISKSIPAN